MTPREPQWRATLAGNDRYGLRILVPQSIVPNRFYRFMSRILLGIRWSRLP